MKKFYSYTKYQNLKTKIESYKEQLPRIEDKIEDARNLLDKRLRRKNETMDKINFIKEELKRIKKDYHILVKNYCGERVTNTPLPKRWRKQE